MKDDENIKFVVTHYRRGCFAVKPGLMRMGFRQATWTPVRIAASVAVVAVLSATAAIMITHRYFASSPETVSSEQRSTLPQKEVKPAAVSVSVIDFEATPLPEVVAKIRDVYGVDVINLPENAESYRLSLHYEGNAADLVETINETLGTEMKIKDQ